MKRSQRGKRAECLECWRFEDRRGSEIASTVNDLVTDRADGLKQPAPVKLGKDEFQCFFGANRAICEIRLRRLFVLGTGDAHSRFALQ